jgi:adenine-specific DNA methylase
MRPVTYGMPRWRDMFSPRQLLAHGAFVEEFRRLIPEVQAAVSGTARAEAVLALLAMMQNKALNYNAYLSSWHVAREVMRSVFERHDFSFKWTYAEFEGAQELYRWSLDQIVDAYEGIAGLLWPEGGPQTRTTDGTPAAPVGEVRVSCANAGDLPKPAAGSQELVCIDPPYYDNVMYAELADFFYVWEKRTLGHMWPELFRDELTDKSNEAVANVARFASAGRRKRELADADYEAKMTAIFAECDRVLRPDGVLTVMFTHRRAEAWDTLGTSLLDAGFSIETSWPVPTEREQSLHQAEQNSASSTIFLVCRKRSGDEGSRFFEEIESQVRRAAREALTRFSNAGLSGVDLLLSTYGPVLSVLSEHWPVFSSEPDAQGNARRLRPEDALDVARAEVVRLQRAQLVGREIEFDPITDWYLIAWANFRAAEFPFDLARRLGLSCGGLDMDELERAKVIRQRAGMVELLTPDKRLRRDAESELPGVHRDRVAFPVLLDALHTALYVTAHDGPAQAKAWLDQRGLTRSDRFVALLQAAANAIPRAKVRGSFSRPEAQAIDRLVTAHYPDITLPADPLEAEQERLFD